MLLFFALFAVYLANGTETDEGDALPSIKLPFALLSYHRLSFEPAWFPDLFDFRGHPPFVEKSDITFPTWAWTYGNKMRKSKHTEEQMVRILREADKGSVADVAKQHGVSDQTIYVWRRKFGAMDVDDAKRLKVLETENARGQVLQRRCRVAAYRAEHLQLRRVCHGINR